MTPHGHQLENVIAIALHHSTKADDPLPDLTAPSNELDGRLYNLLLTSIPGHKKLLVKRLQGPKPSYVQARIILAHDFNHTMSYTKEKTFDLLDQLEYNGHPNDFLLKA